MRFEAALRNIGRI